MPNRRDILVGATAVAEAVASGTSLAKARDTAIDPVVLPPERRSTSQAPAGKRQRLSLDPGWRFVEGDVPVPPIRDHEAAYAHAKAGNAEGAAAADFDDSEWTLVNLPHDWALDQACEPDNNPDQGYRKRGIGWYRRYFQLDEADADLSLELQFGAIATHAEIWINGTLAHRHFNGYTGFTIDLAPFARFGDDINTLAVRVDAGASEGWWYEGAGIYRHVWLIKRAPVHIVTDGVQADPRRDAAGGWTVPVVLTIANQTRTAAQVMAVAVLRDPEGRIVGQAAQAVAVSADAGAVAALGMAVPGPALWSVDKPVLYSLETRLVQDGAAIDGQVQALGFRTLRFDGAEGFFLNDQPLKIKGLCAHQDHAGVGVAVPDSLWDFRLRRLKAMGANALRCAHNPPAPELLDAADRFGVLVMIENRIFSASDAALKDLAAIVRRDRNHPSVILWSLCNEESLQSSRIGVAMIRRMKAVVRALDPVRPITAALNGAMFAQPNIADELDVVGFNYGQAHYDRFHAAHPKVPLLGSEDTAAYMTRGALRTDPARHELADDDSARTGFGQSWREAWRSVASRPFVAGAFAWTGFDYRGEPAPYAWPSASASFGALDLCGFAKSAFHIRRALWSDDEPVLELNPHWTWPGREGEVINVMVITNAERVVLRLNGRMVADVAIDPFAMATVPLAYAPGRLEAMALRGGRPVAHRSVETAGPPMKLSLTPDRLRLQGDGRDTVPVTVQAVDAKGRPVPTAQHPIAFAVVGGAILGVGNGDPNSHEKDGSQDGGRSAGRHLFNGLAQVLLQTSDATGPVILRATTAGLVPALVRLEVEPVQVPTLAAPNGRQTLTEWREAPPSATIPDLGRTIGDDDMNSWGWIKPGSIEPGDPAARYVLLQTRFTPRTRVAAEGGMVVFTAVAGIVQIWLDGRLVGSHRNPRPARITVPLAPGLKEHSLQLLFDNAQPGTTFGLAGGVSVVAPGEAPAM